jgi:hypothetical protein
LNRPTQYQVDIEWIIIHRPIGNIETNIHDIAPANSIHHDLIKSETKHGVLKYFRDFGTDPLPKITWEAFDT